MATMVTVNVLRCLVAAIIETGLQSVDSGKYIVFHPRIIEIRDDFQADTEVTDDKDCQDELPHGEAILLKSPANCNRRIVTFRQSLYPHGPWRFAAELPAFVLPFKKKTVPMALYYHRQPSCSWGIKRRQGTYVF